MTDDYSHLPTKLHDLIEPTDIPESYTELKNDLQWYAELLHDRDAVSFVDVGKCLAGCNHSNSTDAWEFTDVYDRLAENRTALKNRLDDDGWETLVRLLHLLVALEDRVVDTKYLRKYSGNKPGTSGTVYDIGMVDARLNARVYKLTEKSSAVFTNAQTYSGFTAVGSGRFDVSFPRDVDAWFDSHYDEYMSAEEVREFKEREKADA